jgi:hypothetical protein
MEKINVRRAGASYSLPVYKVEDKELVFQDKYLDVDFVKIEKEESAMAILELVEKDGKLMWAFEKDDTKLEFELDNQELRQVTATRVSTEPLKYQLEIYDGDKNVGITNDGTGVLNEKHEKIDLNNPPEVAYIAATDIPNIIPAQEGVTIENLLDMITFDLAVKNKEIPSRETSIAITKLQEAAMWLAKRASDRKQRGVINTNEK